MHFKSEALSLYKEKKSYTLFFFFDIREIPY